MITIVAPFYRYLNGKIKALWRRNNLANNKKLLFWKQDILGSNLIAVDISKRKLLYINQVNDKSACLMIDLKDVHSCTIKKQYHSISAGGLVQKKLQDYLKSILLQVSFKSSNLPIALSFFEEQRNMKEEAEYLEMKAKEWEVTISKLLPKQIFERA
jgi:hypothetical protein